jgi:hypothetical protein
MIELVGSEAGALEDLVARLLQRRQPWSIRPLAVRADTLADIYLEGSMDRRPEREATGRYMARQL